MPPDRFCPTDPAPRSRRSALATLALVAAAAASAGLAGCGSVDLSPPRSLGGTVTVTAAAAGKEVTMRPDQELVVRLPTEPVRGYQWRPAGPAATEGQAVLTSLGPPRFEREILTTNEFENAGFDIYRFRPRGPGQQTLRFEYRRPGVVDTTPPREMWFLVTVK